jgi:hypothetical protein
MGPPRLNHCNKLGGQRLGIMNVTTWRRVQLKDDAIDCRKRTYCRFELKKIGNQKLPTFTATITCKTVRSLPYGYKYAQED